MALSSPGLGSNLDVNGIISKLMTVESQPLQKLAKKEASYQAQLSAYGSLSGALSSFQGTVNGLASLSKFQALSATPADSTILSASASSSAAAGSYSVNVATLAQAQSVYAAGQASTTAAIGSGASTTLTFQFGSISGGTLTNGKYTGATFTQDASRASGTVTIDSSNNTLEGIRDAVNAANIGVSATIINDGSATPNRLVFTSKTSGATSAMKIAVSGDATLDSLLAYDPAGTQNLTQSVVAQNATATINGIAVSSSTNTLTSAIQGVTLNLAKVGATNLTVARDTSAVQSAVQSFVNAYNQLDKTLKSLNAYDAQTKQAGPLQGDYTVALIQSQIKSTLSSPLTGVGGSLTSLSQIGVSFQKDGTLALDTAKLNTAMSSNFLDVGGLFAPMGRTTDSLVSFSSSTTKTKPGNYTVEVSSLAAQGKLTGSASFARGYATGSQAAALTIAAPNDVLKLTLDGVGPTSVSLTNTTYASAAALVTGLQADIDAALGANKVVVTQNNGVLTLNSTTAGGASAMAVDPTSTALATLFGTATSGSGTVIASGVNDTLSVTVDGTNASVTLSPGIYSASALVAQVQSAINGASALSAAGAGVQVSESAGVMTITSTRYGSASSVSVSGNGASGIIGVAPTATAGADVAGKIGGVTASASGQYMTGIAGGNAEGLKLQITGGNTGARGSVYFSEGYATKLNRLLDGYLSSSGLVTSKRDGVQKSIKDIGKYRETLNARLAAIEERYRAQFTALDKSVASMTQTSNFLSQQLANLPKSGA
jgi:flagellar hook-associated protein 2